MSNKEGIQIKRFSRDIKVNEVPLEPSKQF